MPAFTWVGDLEQQKQWPGRIPGPLATWFDVYFDGYTGGYVYRRSSDPGNYERGGALPADRGYDDNREAWICKNSWGTGGARRLRPGRIRRGRCRPVRRQPSAVSTPIRNKRRAHNGNLYESGNGGTRTAPLRSSAPPAEPSAITGARAGRRGPGTCRTSSQRRRGLPDPTGRRTTATSKWSIPHAGSGQLTTVAGGGGGSRQYGGVFEPSTCQGVPGFVQSYDGARKLRGRCQGRRGTVAAPWRMAGPPWTWFEGPRFGSDIRDARSQPRPERLLRATHGNLECVAVLSTGQMQQLRRN